MNFDEIKPELKMAAEQCETPEEILKLAAEEGYELSDDELQAISGGDWCGSHCSAEGCQKVEVVV